MPLLQVRDIPEDLYNELSKVAKQDNRSIAQETIVLLRSALKLDTERVKRRKELLAEAKALNIDNADKLPDPVDLIREDRER
jgi:plasmid stability protein